MVNKKEISKFMGSGMQEGGLGGLGMLASGQGCKKSFNILKEIVNNFFY